MNCGLRITIGQILNSNQSDWEQWSTQLLDFTCETEEEKRKNMEGYKYSWWNCFSFLKENLPEDVNQNIEFIFEYRIPLREGRRPDIVVLTDKKIVVLEFKATNKYNKLESDQKDGYVHYFKTCHEFTLNKNLNIDGYLVRTQDSGQNNNKKDVLDKIIFKKKLSEILSDCDVSSYTEDWLNSDTIYNPYIIQNIDKIVKNAVRPEFKYLLDDGDLGDCLKFVEEKIIEAKDHHKKIVLIVDGVPGSGKTYLGLKIAFDNKSNCHPSIYLSGNGPLVKFLQDVFNPNAKKNLNDSQFIKSMADFKRTYGNSTMTPKHSIIVFDEAQRAWNKRKMGSKYNASEIELLLQIGNRIANQNKFCIILSLIGSGQAIYDGEEDGLELWTDAIKNNLDWEFYASNESATKIHHNAIKVKEKLHLTASVRNNFVDISEWIKSLIENRSFDEQKALYEHIKAQGFEIRLIRRLDILTKLKPAHYSTESYGILASSLINTNYHFTKDIQKILNNGVVKKNEVASWFRSSCQDLNTYATEFVCQGLELDWPIVLLGGDFYIRNGKWSVELEHTPRWLGNLCNKTKTEIVRNVYYVLLTRGRKGMILIVPEGDKFNETYEKLKDMGIEWVPEKDEEERCRAIKKIWNMMKAD